jgi:hypothetical protein
MKLSFIVLIVTQLAFSSCDTRCNKQTCQAMRRSSCLSKRFSSEPLGFCLSRGAFSAQQLAAADINSTVYCETSCNEEKGGAFAQCVLDNESLCIGADGLKTLENMCKYPHIFSSDEACFESCSAVRSACEVNCPITSVRACMDCSSNCGLEVIRCRRKCN